MGHASSLYMLQRISVVVTWYTVYCLDLNICCSQGRYKRFCKNLSDQNSVRPTLMINIILKEIF